MSEEKGAIKSKFTEAMEIGSDPNIPVKDAVSMVWGGVKADYAAAKNYNVLYAQLSDEDQKLIERNVVLNTFLEAIRRSYYKNMRTLKNDIEDALNIEVLIARGILTSDTTAGE